MGLRNSWRKLVLLCAVGCGLTALVARADDPSTALQSVSFRGQGFVVRTVDPKKEELELFLKFDKDVYLHDFSGLETYVASKGEKLLFAANAGMFKPDSSPVGLLVLDGSEITPLDLKDGDGNFYMKPNGIFLINEKHEAHIIESSEYATLLSPAVCATQSGPLLVHGGGINPDFNADSKSLKIRSGVGVRKDGTIVFALSHGPVSFYNFASLFLDRLKCPNALYLDGDVSAFYVPGMKNTAPQSFGPMFGLVEKAKSP
jgi:uncharacterized protein YigE (DUF2233 family)